MISIIYDTQESLVSPSNLAFCFAFPSYFRILFFLWREGFFQLFQLFVFDLKGSQLLLNCIFIIFMIFVLPLSFFDQIGRGFSLFFLSYPNVIIIYRLFVCLSIGWGMHSMYYIPFAVVTCYTALLLSPAVMLHSTTVFFLFVIGCAVTPDERAHLDVLLHIYTIPYHTANLKPHSFRDFFLISFSPFLCVSTDQDYAYLPTYQIFQFTILGKFLECSERVRRD